jgi:hypothetical protein
MSDQESNPKPTLKDRLMPRLRTAAIALPTGIAIGFFIRFKMNGEGWLSDSTFKQVHEEGMAMLPALPDGTRFAVINLGLPEYPVQ